MNETPPRHRFTVKLTQRHLGLAQRLYLFRRGRRRLWVAFSLLAALWLYVVVTGGRHWLWGANLVAGGIFALALIVLWSRARRANRSFLHLLECGTIHYELADEHLGISHAAASSQVKWHAVAEVVTSPRIWLVLFRTTRGFFPIPPDQAPEDALIFLTSAVVSHGGKVDGAP